MASLHRVNDSRYWQCAFYYPDGRRALRSTGQTDKKKAWAVCLKFAEAGEAGREGRLSQARARAVIADCYAIAARDQMPSATVKDFLGRWLEKKSLEVTESSMLEYRGCVDHLLNFMDNGTGRHMDAIGPDEISRFRDSLAKRLAGGTVNKIMKILRGAWRDGLRDGLMPSNVFDRVRLVKAAKSTRRAFKLDEVKRILAIADAEWRGVILTGLYTGQRLGDIALLTWNMVDLQEREIHFITRKTGAPVNIPIGAPLMRHYESMPSTDDPQAPLFPHCYEAMQTGKGTGTLSTRFADILVAAGLRKPGTRESTGKGRSARRDTSGMSFHCLRHTATSLLKNAGVSDVVAREIIGHDSEAVSKTYTHIERDTLRDAVAKLPDVTR